MLSERVKNWLAGPKALIAAGEVASEQDTQEAQALYERVGQQISQDWYRES